MNHKPVTFVVISLSVAALFYISSFPISFHASAESSGPVGCQRTGTVQVTCCQEHIINRSPSNPAGTLVTYCTDCEVPPGGATWLGDYRNCSERYIKASAEILPSPPPALSKLLESGLEETTPQFGQSLGSNFGGVLQSENNLTFTKANISSNDSSTGILGIEQSDAVSNEAENGTKTVNDEEQDEGEETEEEQDESGASKVQGRESTDEAEDNDKENIDEELPLE